MLRAFSNSVEALKEGRGLIVLAIEQMDSHGSLIIRLFTRKIIRTWSGRQLKQIAAWSISKPRFLVAAI
jgi:hypothetical protein